MTDIIAFGSSWQPHYSSGSGGKRARGFHEHRESCPRVQRKIDWPPQLLIPGVIRKGACLGTPRHLQSPLSWESDLWGLNLGGQSLLQCGPLRARCRAVGGLDAWGQSCLRCPPSHSNNKSVPFHLGPSGHFSWLFQSRSNSHCWGFSLLPGSFFPPPILYHNIPSEPAVTLFKKLIWFKHLFS